jgi:hypothetical protein
VNFIEISSGYLADNNGEMCSFCAYLWDIVLNGEKFCLESVLNVLNDYRKSIV